MVSVSGSESAFGVESGDLIVCCLRLLLTAVRRSQRGFYGREQLVIREPSHFTRNSSCPPSWVQHEMAAIKAKRLFSQKWTEGVTLLCKRRSDRVLGHVFKTLCE